MRRIFIEVFVNCSSQIISTVLTAAFSLLIGRFINSERIKRFLTIFAATILIGLAIFIVSYVYFSKWHDIFPDDPIVKIDEIHDGKPYIIENVVSVKPLAFWFIDKFRWYGYSDFTPSVFDDAADKKFNEYFGREHYQHSGSAAEFLWLLVNVTNLSKQSIKFAAETKVTVIYKDSYQYNGWVRQAYTYENVNIMTNSYTDSFPFVCFKSEDETLIKPMYTSNYVFGCELPNAVMQDKASPLRMIIKIGERIVAYDFR